MHSSDRMDDRRKAVIWREWKKGSPMSLIARVLEKPPATVFSYLLYHGGIQPRVRCRRSIALAIEEREEISRGLANNHSIRSIALHLGRSASTISREISRNGGVSKYRAMEADKSAWKRATRPKPCRLAVNTELKSRVTQKLSEDWSPEQISSWLKITYADNVDMHVSHETIYRSLFIQTRGLFRKELRDHLRTKRKFRHSRNHRAGSRGQIIDGISIRERPAAVEDRAVPGHWEGDLICGAKNSYIATVVERQTRFTILVRVESKNTEHVVGALSKQMSKLPELLQQSLTWDRGPEMARHHAFTLATNMDVYFCDPRSPWQRGINENTNGLLRQGILARFPAPASLQVGCRRLRLFPDVEGRVEGFVEQLARHAQLEDAV
jgi:IS30 family transposase